MKSISSLDSLESYGDDHFELDDHRNQPFSLPMRPSLSEPRPVDPLGHGPAPGAPAAAATTSSPRGRERASSCAVSEHSVSSEDVAGILLNPPPPPPPRRQSSELPASSPMRKRSRRLTRSSAISGDDREGIVKDTGSRASGDSEIDEQDVCFPMSKQGSHPDNVDIGELDRFAVEVSAGDDLDRVEYKTSLSRNQAPRGQRPLAPMGLAVGTNTGSSDETKVYQDGPGKSVYPPTSASAAAYAQSRMHQQQEQQQHQQQRRQSQAPPAGFPGTAPAPPLGGGLNYEKFAVDEESPEVTWGQNRRMSMYHQDRYSYMTSESDITIHSPDLASLVEEGQSFSDLFNGDNGATWWLNCLDPSEREMRVLSKAFGIHPLTAEDIRTQETREKVELFRNYYFVCFHTFDNDSESPEFLSPINVFMVVFKQGIISFHYTPIQHPANVRRRIRQLQDYVTVSSDWICYALLDDITDSFAPIIKEVEYETDGIEDSVFHAADADFGPMLHRIGHARKNVMSLLRLLFGKADVIKMFAKRCNERWDNAPREEIVLYLGDIQDHIVTMYQNLSVYEKIFSRSHANYLAQLQVQTVRSNNRTTTMLGRMTIAGTILLPLNLVTGLFGMNVKIPGQDGPNLGWFFGIVGFMILFIVVVGSAARWWIIRMERQDTPQDEEHGTLLGKFERTNSMANSIRSNKSRLNRSLSLAPSRR